MLKLACIRFQGNSTPPVIVRVSDGGGVEIWTGTGDVTVHHLPSIASPQNIVRCAKVTATDQPDFLDLPRSSWVREVYDDTDIKSDNGCVCAEAMHKLLDHLADLRDWRVCLTAVSHRLVLLPDGCVGVRCVPGMEAGHPETLQPEGALLSEACSWLLQHSESTADLACVRYFLADMIQLPKFTVRRAATILRALLAPGTLGFARPSASVFESKFAVKPPHGTVPSLDSFCIAHADIYGYACLRTFKQTDGTVLLSKAFEGSCIAITLCTLSTATLLDILATFGNMGCKVPMSTSDMASALAVNGSVQFIDHDVVVYEFPRAKLRGDAAACLAAISRFTRVVIQQWIDVPQLEDQ